MHTEFAHLGQSATAAVQITLSSDYGWVVLVAVLLALEIVAIGFIFPGRARSKCFTKEFMELNFGQEHKQSTGKDIGEGGYPDMGSGRYSQKLTYEEWYLFNNYQRVHANYLEFAPSIFIALLAAGIYFPIAAAAIGLALFVARLAYSIGYVSGGPAGRLIGALGNHFSVLALLGLGFASGAYLVQGK